MSDSTPKYWQSLAARNGDPALLERARQEFPEELPVGVSATAPDETTRRDFFKVMGLSAAAAMAACSKAPLQKVLPYVSKPDELTPGLALWYASTCGACAAGCGVLLKTRDGRPIKVEGNAEHPVSRGGVCATGQASVLSLYDASRARSPSVDRKASGWAGLDAQVITGLQQVTWANKAIRLVLPWRLGPTEEAAVARFLAAYPTARTVRFDPTGEIEAIALAHEITHGARRLPSYRFDRAKVIASFSADFLGTWVSPVAFTRQYADGRQVTKASAFSRHWQLEPLLSLTGASADQRIPVAPSEQVPALAGLVGRLAAKAGKGVPGLEQIPPTKVAPAVLDALARELWEAREAGLVVCGNDEPGAQVLVNTANALLGNEGTTVSVAEGMALDAAALSYETFLGELSAQAVGAVLFHGVNPAYSHPKGDALEALLKDVPVTVATRRVLDETAALVRFHAPDSDPLESWGDAEIQKGVLSLRQPVVAPLYETRSAMESLLAWAGEPKPFHDFLRARWEAEVFPRVAGTLDFSSFWDFALRQGVVTTKGEVEGPAFRDQGLPQAFAGLPHVDGGLSLVLYQKVALRDGELANNGWLQELPDPISKATWNNYLCLAPSLAAQRGLQDGSVVRVRVGERSLKVPVLVQPGTHPDAVGLAVGYGRTRAGRLGNGVGQNAFTLARVDKARLHRTVTGVVIEPLAEHQPLALTQTHASQEGRALVREATFAEFLKNPRAGNEAEGEPSHAYPLSLWSGHKYEGHRWAMAINLSACTGCSACVVSCQAENNIPVVGEQEVRRGREMHWMRIDRYYSGEPDSPRVLHQPLMCQHCENAPCETVCPVLATVHSSEGLNQQIYNRCVGTRYCANNCPTKVRRFNWFDYDHEDPVERMVLNPDVVVRSRGVMEKCSLCVQRIQEGKALAHREGRALQDQEIRTACQQSCPAQAIVFGDVNDPKSEIHRLTQDGRAYRLLEDLNVGASITYLTRIRNGESGSVE